MKSASEGYKANGPELKPRVMGVIEPMKTIPPLGIVIVVVAKANASTPSRPSLNSIVLEYIRSKEDGVVIPLEGKVNRVQHAYTLHPSKGAVKSVASISN